MERVDRSRKLLKRLFGELQEIYPERHGILTQIEYGLLSREHVLVFGTFGTGKSDMLGALYEAIEGAKTFSIALSKFMTENHVIGVPDPTILREKGYLHHVRDGNILDADIVELDEMLDATPPLLRVLLGVLNERTFKRGRQFEEAKLHSAVACTNGIPEEEVRLQPQLGAVIDRFLFQAKVSYLTERDSRIRMYRKHLDGKKPVTHIDLADLKYLVNAVRAMYPIDDEHLLATYDDIVNEYVKKTNKVISDRRRCKALELVRIHAMLAERKNGVQLEDLMGTRWALCMGNVPSDHETFAAVAQPIIAKAREERPQTVDEVQAKLLATIKEKLPDDVHETPDDLIVERARLLKALKDELADIRPTEAPVIAEREALIKEVNERIETLNGLIYATAS